MFHHECEVLAKEHVNILKTNNAEYVCLTCLYSDEMYECYDYDTALQRLSDAAKISLDTLKKATQNENVFLRQENMHYDFRRQLLPRTFEIDNAALALIEMFGGAGSKVPCKSKQDGNCFFNSLSLALIGNELLTKAFRVKTTIEMAINQNIYELKLQERDIHLVSANYNESMLSCAIDGRDSTPMMMPAAATVANVDINTVYPPVNGLLDKASQILTTTFHPLYTKPTRKVDILWTNTYKLFGGPKAGDGIWTPNHFVPLIDKSNLNAQMNSTSPVIELSNDECLEGFMFNDANKINRQIKDETEFDFDINDGRGNNIETFGNEGFYPNKIPDKWCEPKNNDRNFSDAINIVPKSLLYPDDDGTPKPGTNEPASINTQLRPLRYPGKFMQIEETMKLLLTEKTSERKVPAGIKENIYLILSNIENCNRRLRGKKALYEDDCGTWHKGSVKTHHFVYNEEERSFRSVDCIKGIYMTKKCGERVSLIDQPCPDDVVVVKRYYATLKRQEEYKKRVTWIETLAKI